MRHHPYPTIIDIEASGFGSRSYPIEIGVIKANGERYCALIKPQDEWQHWSSDAEAMHGISRDVLCRRGKPVRQVCTELNQFLGEITAYSDAWTHDSAWLNCLFFAARIQPLFHLSPIEMIASEAQLLIWDATKKKLAKEHGARRHRASVDAHLIQQTYLRTRTRLQAEPQLALRGGLL
ncbi:hypothetical protein O59_003561 [Cellvibrio sp. BR]|uniref:hypothetical protein n=1 Tax=Cellvibrio sp. BR TaxID=1134474 RepID=UPI000260116C|nr:hypothetical protein [Cellvibrio sp. BR]EIK43681.1 hypothetical protein O59_003561 [Cellvibrio sp. BR]